jgi:PAS domain-containing protein
MSRNVSDTELAELAADEAQRATLDFAVSHSPAIFYVAELAGKQPVRFISANVETITGHKVSAFIADANYGRDFIHPEDLPGYHMILRRLKRDGAITHEYRFAGTDGEYRWFRDELRLVGPNRKKATEFAPCRGRQRRHHPHRHGRHRQRRRIRRRYRVQRRRRGDVRLQPQGGRRAQSQRTDNPRGVPKTT